MVPHLVPADDPDGSPGPRGRRLSGAGRRMAGRKKARRPTARDGPGDGRGLANVRPTGRGYTATDTDWAGWPRSATSDRRRSATCAPWSRTDAAARGSPDAHPDGLLMNVLGWHHSPTNDPASRPMPPDAQDIADEERGVAYGTVADEPLLLDVYRPPARADAPAGRGPRPRRRDVDRLPRAHGRPGAAARAGRLRRLLRRLPPRRGRHRAPPLAGPARRRPARRALGARQRRPATGSTRVASAPTAGRRAASWRRCSGRAIRATTRRAAGGLPQPRGVRRRPRRRRGPGGVHAPARPGRGRGPPGRDARGGARALPRCLAALLDRRADGPFLVVHGAPDDVVPVAQSRRLVSALRAAGVEVEYAELPDAGHGDLTWSRVGPVVLAFLGRHLRPGD